MLLYFLLCLLPIFEKMEVIALSEYLFTEPAMEILHFVLLCTTEFLNLCTIDIWGQMIVIWGIFCIAGCQEQPIPIL